MVSSNLKALRTLVHNISELRGPSSIARVPHKSKHGGQMHTLTSALPNHHKNMPKSVSIADRLGAGKLAKPADCTKVSLMLESF